MDTCACWSGPWGRRNVIGLALIAVGGFTIALAAGAAEPTPKSELTPDPVQSKDGTANQGKAASLNDAVNQGLGLSQSQVLTLQVDPTPGVTLTVDLEIDGQPSTLHMWPHTVRAAAYRVQAQIEDGSLVEVEPGPSRTLRGTVLELPGTLAAGSLMENGLHARIIMPGGDEVWLEPIGGRIEGAAANQYVLYRSADVIADAGTCGTTDAHQVENPVENPGDGGGIAGGTLVCAELACDADFEYYQDHGSSVSNVEAQINNIINAVNVQYEDEVDIRHVITDIIVRTAEPDPYSSTDAGGLLCQFRNHWNANHGSIQRDVAHLFTGKSIVGGTIGIAFLGTVCNVSGNNCGGFGNLAYSLVESDFSGVFSCKTDLSAHELGHNWDATHCPCPSFTMNPSLTCANNHEAGSIAEIIAFRNTRTCLGVCEDGVTTLPFFDDFPTTTIDDTKWTGVEGATVSTVGLAEPSAPNSLNLDGGVNGGDEIRSAIINTTGLTNLTLSYFYQRTGGGESPDPNDDLVIEYLNNTSDWVELHRQLGSGPDMTTFLQVTSALPANAVHANFRVRFRAISPTNNSDDWFIDNVNITATVPPSNNNCAQSTIAPAGSHPFNTTGATTDGPNEPAGCNFGGFTQIDNDVWYLYPAQCTGTATIGLCNASFNSKLAVYGGTCPAAPGLTITCADNTCGDDPQVSFPVVQGQVFRIRVGGTNGAFGSGTMVITCTPPGTPCPSDVNGDNVTNVDDLLGVINAWGPCAGCPADVNDDNVVNVDDLLDVINGWGSCP